MEDAPASDAIGRIERALDRVERAVTTAGPAEAALVGRHRALHAAAAAALDDLDRLLEGLR